MKEGLKFFSSYQVAALRISIAGLCLLPFIRWKKVNILPSELKWFAISGVLGNCIPAFLFTAAQTKISSSLTGALNALTPLFALAVGVMFMGIVLSRNKIMGVLLGLLGALMLIFNQGLDLEASQPGYTFLIVMAAVLYGINVNIIKTKLGHYPPLLVASLPLGIISIIGIVVLINTGLPVELAEVQFHRSFFATVILAVVGTALSLIMFNHLIQRTNAVFASSVTYLIPIVAMIWGFLDHEEINFNQIAGLVLILLAIRIINKKKKLA